MTAIQPTNQPAPMRSPEQPREMTVAPCPRCQGTNAMKVSFTWWGGVLGPRVFNVVRCLQCNTQYNGKTGGALTKGILIYTGVAVGIGILVAVLMAMAR